MQTTQTNFGTIRLGVALIAFYVLVSIVGCTATPTSQSTGQYIDDAAITAKVKAELAKDQRFAALQVHVISYKGVVDLSGFVDSEHTKERASEIATQVAGVKEVRNNLIVKTQLPGS